MITITESVVKIAYSTDDNSRMTKANKNAPQPEAEESDECSQELEFKSLLLDAVSEGILAHTTEGELVYFNDAACLQLGYSREEFAQVGAFGWVDAPLRAMCAERLVAMRTSGPLKFESRGLTKSGQVIHTEVHSRVVRSSGRDLVVSVVSHIDDRVAAMEKVHHLAFHDDLTGLPNRTMLEQRLLEAAATASPEGLIGLVYLDLDEFKPVNDVFGHIVGDRVLQILARRMEGCVREGDTVARFGGDEFVALAAGLPDMKALASIALKLVESISQPLVVREHRVEVSASAGIAVYQPGENLADLLQRADRAMYQAKRDGQALLAETPDADQ